MGQLPEATRCLEYISKELRFEISDDPSAHIRKYCIPKTKLKTYMTTERLRSLLDAYHIFDINPETVRNSYLAVFTNLLYIDKGNYIPFFTHSRLLTDSFLPFGKDRWPMTCDFFEKFNERQSEFCAVELRPDSLEEMSFNEHEIVPITEREPLKGGHRTDSSTYRIKVHPDYDFLPKNSRDFGSPRYFVLKSCPADNAQSYRNEVRGYKVLRRYDEISNNIARYYGSWRQGNTCNILLEYINGGTLTNLFCEDPPTSPEDMLILWGRILDIMDPLCKIHSHRNPKDQSIISTGVHQDIKPDNILIHRISSGRNYNFIFKLADLGLAYFEAGDTDQQVLGRELPGTQMYSAPECFRDERDLVDYRSTRPVDALKDIWSIGCVLSEFAVWSVLGPRALKEYHELRVAATDEVPDLQHTAYSGCFHNGKVALSVVRDMHLRVRRSRRNADQIVNDVLPIIEDMLRDVNELRPDAANIRKRFRSAVETAKSISPIPEAEAKFPEIFRNLTGTNMEDSQRKPRTSASMSTRAPNIWYSVDPSHPPRARAFDPNITSSSLLPVSSPHDLKPRPPLRAQTDGPSSSRFPLITSQAESHYTTQSTSRDGGFSTFKPTRPVSNPVIYTEPDSLLENLPTLNTNAVNPAAHSDSAAGAGNPRNSKTPSTDNSSPQSSPRGSHATVMQVLAWIEERKKKKGKWPHSLPGGVEESSLSILHGRDQIFLIDNSASMSEHRENVINTFKALAYLVKRFDPDGMDLYFTNHPEEGHGKDREKLISLLKRVRFSGECSMDGTLTKILDQRNQNWLSSLLKRYSKKMWGLSIYVLTDGVWNNPQNASTGGIPRLIQRITAKMDGRANLGIQFIQFGENPVGTARLEKLDNDLVTDSGVELDIIDTTRWDGNVYKMLHGAIDETWDQRSSIDVPLSVSPVSRGS